MGRGQIRGFRERRLLNGDSLPPLPIRQPATSDCGASLGQPESRAGPKFREASDVAAELALLAGVGWYLPFVLFTHFYGAYMHSLSLAQKVKDARFAHSEGTLTRALPRSTRFFREKCAARGGAQACRCVGETDVQALCRRGCLTICESRTRFQILNEACEARYITKLSFSWKAWL